MSKISDNSGGPGYGAKVDSKNNLWTRAVSIPAEEDHAVDGDSYIAHGECHTAAATGGGLMSLKNNYPNKEVVITRIYIDSHTITPTDLVMVQVFEPATTTSGTDITSTGIVQKHLGKQNAAKDNLTLTISDGSANLTYTGGTKYHAPPLPTMTSQTREMKGTNVITPNKTILWGFKRAGGGSATDAEIVSLSVNFILRDLT